MNNTKKYKDSFIDDFDGCNPVSVRCLLSKKVRIGWILHIPIDNWYVKSSDKITQRIKEALVFVTREKAREYRWEDNMEIVRKVELFKNGKAKKIIRGR